MMEMSFDLKDDFGEKDSLVKPKMLPGMISAPELFRNILGVEKYEKIIE